MLAEAIEPIVNLVVQGLVFPGLFFTVFMIVFTQWMYRKIAARIQYRRGPCYTGPFGFLQPFADFMKLLMKEDVVSRYSLRLPPVILATLGLGSLVTLMLLTPLAYNAFYSELDVVLFFYLALWASLAILFLGISTPNPYTSLGVGRYMALLASAEPAYIASFITPVIIASKYYGARYSVYLTAINSYKLWFAQPSSLIAMALAAVAGFLALMAILEIKPFDFPEAEGEIYWGVLTEYGGPRLALAFFILFTERIVLPIIYVFLFLGGSWPIDIASNYWLGFLVVMVKFLILFLVLSVIDNIMPRLRPDQGVGFIWKYILPLAVLGLIAAVF